MSADTPHPSSPSRRPGRGLLGWLGLSGDDDALADGPLPAPDHAGDDDDPVRLAKRQLMADVTQFLISHDLEISPFTMGLAHDYFTGNDGQIMRRIEGRIQSGEPITIEWLEETVRETRGEPHVELARLMSTLENNI